MEQAVERWHSVWAGRMNPGMDLGFFSSDFRQSIFTGHWAFLMVIGTYHGKCNISKIRSTIRRKHYAKFFDVLYIEL